MNFEEKIEDISRDVKAHIKELGDKLERRLDAKFKEHKHHSQRRKVSTFWGLALIIFGGLLLINHLFGIDWDIPIVPLAMIVLGGYLIFKSGKND